MAKKNKAPKRLDQRQKELEDPLNIKYHKLLCINVYLTLILIWVLVYG